MKILVVTGSSGGHIFPALSFIEELKDEYPDVEIVLVLPRAAKNYLLDNIEKYKIIHPGVIGRIKYISISPVSLSFNFKNIRAVLNLIRGFFEAVFVLISVNPGIVVGFGSLISLPVVLCARIFRVNILIHEQNVIPGKATRFLSKISDRVAISFEETREYFKDKTGKIVLTGNPIRKQMVKMDETAAGDFFGLDNQKFTILVLGGSQGSQRINREFLKFISAHPDKSRIQIIHLSGSQDYGLLRDSYKDLGVSVKLFSFLEPMQYAYSLADLIVSRAGATTITELIYFKIPAILIPYPYAYQHQLANARILENKGCCFIINDNELSADSLNQVLRPLIYNPQGIEKMRLGYNVFSALEAEKLLVKEVMSLGSKGRSRVV
ncbi:MAG: undecaprenyldiphospho-muramoylpentapeptide beta-N-acetylglucosaminyltransferase [Candidatus Omnitrophota bacterium]